MKTRILSLVSVLLLVFAVACGDDDNGADSDSADTSSTTSTTEAEETTTTTDNLPDPVFGSVRIEDAWARSTPPEATNGAAYMVLNASADDRLVGAMTIEDIAEAVEIHETSMDDDTGEMTMRPVEGIDLPANEDVILEPGGYHIMFVGLTQPLEAGTSFDILLTFEIAGDVSASVEVRDVAGGDDHSDHGGGDDGGETESGD